MYSATVISGNLLFWSVADNQTGQAMISFKPLGSINWAGWVPV